MNTIGFGVWTYLCTALLVGLWLAKLKELPWKWGRPWLGWACLTSLCIACYVFWCIPPEYRVLVDEATVTSISYMMQKYQSATTLFMTQWTGDQLLPVAQGIDKRPSLFPFFVHGVHWVLGYSPLNAFGVNFAVFVALLVLVFLGVAPWGGGVLALVSQLLVAAQPAVFLSATSAGLDLCSTLWVGIAWGLTWMTLVTPKPGLLSLTLITLGLLSMTRYESILIAGVMGFALTQIWVRTKKIKLERKWLAPLPLLLSPLLGLGYLLLQPRFHEIEGPVFHGTYFFAHLTQLVHGLFWPPAHYPNLSGFYGVASFSLIFLIWKLYRAESSISKKALALGLGVWGISTGVTLSHFFGSYLQAHALRLFLNFVIPLSVAPSLALALVLPVWFRSGRCIHGVLLVVLMGAGAFFVYSLHARSPQQIFVDVGATRYYQQAHQALAQALNDQPRAETLVVSAYPTEFAIHGFSSINFLVWKENREKILNAIQKKLIKNIFILQTISKENLQPLVDEVISPEMYGNLRQIQQLSISSRNELRISEFTNRFRSNTEFPR